MFDKKYWFDRQKEPAKLAINVSSKIVLTVFFYGPKKNYIMDSKVGYVHTAVVFTHSVSFDVCG